MQGYSRSAEGRLQKTMRKYNVKGSERFQWRKLQLRKRVETELMRSTLWFEEHAGCGQLPPIPDDIRYYTTGEDVEKWLFLERMIPETTPEGRGEVMAVLALMALATMPRLHAMDRKRLLDRLAALDAAIPSGSMALLNRRLAALDAAILSGSMDWLAEWDAAISPRSMDWLNRAEAEVN